MFRFGSHIIMYLLQYITYVYGRSHMAIWHLPYGFVPNPSSLNPQLEPIVTSGHNPGNIWPLYVNQLAMYSVTNKDTMLTSYVTTRAPNQLLGVGTSLAMIKQFNVSIVL